MPGRDTSAEDQAFDDAAPAAAAEVARGAADEAGRPAAPPAGATLVDAEVAVRLRLVVNRLARRLRGQAREGLSHSLLSALASIEIHGPITLGHLAERELVKPPSITRMVAELEERGLVRREADLVDRRVVRVRLTAEGRRTLRRTRTRKTAYLAERLRTLDPADQRVLHEALPVLERLLEDER